MNEQHNVLKTSVQKTDEFQIIKKKIKSFSKTIFYIDNTKCFLCTKSAYYNDFCIDNRGTKVVLPNKCSLSEHETNYFVYHYILI